MSDSFEKIMDEFGPSIYRLALSRTGDREKSADIYQDTFLLLLEKEPVFRHKNQLRIWLMRTAVNLIKRVHSEKSTLPLDDITLTHTDTLEFELYDTVSSLPETLRDAAMMFYIEDMSIKDISKVLGVSVPAVKSRLSRARKILRISFKEDDYE